jgi:putative NADPH-quinone reductase
MGKPIAIIQDHPDASGRHVCHALADEYAKGTEDGGHEVKRIDVARLDFPILRTKVEFEKGALPLSPGPAQEAISWADYLVLFRPQSQEPRAQHPGLLPYRPDQGTPHRHHRGDD